LFPSTTLFRSPVAAGLQRARVGAIVGVDVVAVVAALGGADRAVTTDVVGAVALASLVVAVIGARVTLLAALNEPVTAGRGDAVVGAGVHVAVVAVVALLVALDLSVAALGVGVVAVAVAGLAVAVSGPVTVAVSSPGAGVGPGLGLGGHGVVARRESEEAQRSQQGASARVENCECLSGGHEIFLSPHP